MRCAFSAIVPLLLAACGSQPPPGLPGYVEGEYVQVAAPLAGRITAVNVSRGAQVAQDAPLFSFDAEREQGAAAEAEQRVSAAQARLADLRKGRRPEELDVIRAQLRQARAQQDLATAQFKRQTEMRIKGLSSDEQVDQSGALARAAEARVQELQHQLGVAELSARSDAISAADAEVKGAQAQLAQARWQLAQKSASAPAAGSIEEVYFRAGEWAPAGAPVVSLLPPQNRKLRFFVPEPLLGSLRAGAAVRVRCDGCGEAMGASISFIAAEAEFTPPVLYGREQRDRLVYRVEAQPAPADAPRLHPGQPVDIELPQ